MRRLCCNAYRTARVRAAVASKSMLQADTETRTLHPASLVCTSNARGAKRGELVRAAILPITGLRHEAAQLVRPGHTGALCSHAAQNM